jgi:hypothetical protein
MKIFLDQYFVTQNFNIYNLATSSLEDNYLLISNMQGSTPFKQQPNNVFDANSSTIRKSMPATIETPRIVSKESKVL